MENDKKKPLPPEIIRLSERIAKDPACKLFVPLAEEYQKLGRLEEAETVLVEGLRNHPGYLSAQVLLGKILLRRGDRVKALAEFEQVVQANPENILAHKMLAEIYRDEGRVGDALRSCRSVLAFNPSDPDMQTLRDMLTAGAAQQPVENQETAPPAADDQGGEKVQGATMGGALQSLTLDPESHAPPPPSGIGEPPSEPLPMESSLLHESADTDQGRFSETVTLDMTQGQSAVERTGPGERSEEEDVPVVVLPDEETDVASFLAELDDAKGSEGEPGADAASSGNRAGVSAEGPGALPTVVLNEGGVFPSEAGSAEEAPSFEGESEIESSAEDAFATEALAELYIKQGYYEKGIDIYRKILEQDPRRAGIRQKLEDAITLTNLLGSQGAAWPETDEIEGPGRSDGMEFPPVAYSKKEGSPGTGHETPSPSFREERIRKLEAWLHRIQARSGKR